MNQEKNAYYNNQILNLLLEYELLTVAGISKKVGLSEKTVRTKLEQIAVYLNENSLGNVERKQRVGVWLDADFAQRDHLKKTASTAGNVYFPHGNRDRQKEVIRLLLKLSFKESITTQKIADVLYLSLPTTAGILRESQKWFKKRGIEVVSTRNKGICLECSEYAYRLAVRDFILQDEPEQTEKLLGGFTAGLDIHKIWDIIIQAENAWNWEFTENSRKAVWILASLSVSRRGKGYEWDMLTADVQETVQNYNEYAFAQAVCQKVEEVFKIKIPEVEVEALAFHVLKAGLPAEKVSEGGSRTGIG